MAAAAVPEPASRRRPSHDEERPASESITEWASTLELEKPVRMGDLERAILARPAPPEPTGSDVGLRIRFAIMVGLTALIYLLPLTPPPLLAAAEAATDSQTIGTLLGMAGTGAITGGALPLIVLVVWSHNRPRDFFSVASAIAMPIVAIAASVWLWGSAERMTTMVMVGNLAGLVLSIGVSLVIFLASKRVPEPTVMERAEAHEPDEVRAVRNRALVLRVLNSRGIIDDDTMLRAFDMPLGSWDDLDD